MVKSQVNTENQLRKAVLFAFFLFVQWTLFSQTYVPGNSYFGRNNYTEYMAGNLPLIISVPHGGILTPSEIPDRTCGTEIVSDSYTISLAKEIRDAVFQITGCYPHVIINHLKRIKLDANRDLPEAACGNQYAETAWLEFQKAIDSAKAIVTRTSGKGLYIDLHGHGHTIQRLELGYLLTATQLSYTDATLNLTTYKNYSSIRNLIYSNAANLTHASLLHGQYSLGSMFNTQGYSAVPSAADLFPASVDSYFNGGYNTLRHGSKIEGTIDGIQIECNQDVRFTESTRLVFASRTATVFLDYLTKHYFPQLPLSYCNNVGVEEFCSPEFLLYPNPFESFLSVRSPVPADLRIYNFQGKLVFSRRIDTKEKIDLSRLPRGLYLVTLSNGTRIIYHEKLIKEQNTRNP